MAGSSKKIKFLIPPEESRYMFEFYDTWLKSLSKEALAYWVNSYNEFASRRSGLAPSDRKPPAVYFLKSMGLDIHYDWPVRRVGPPGSPRYKVMVIADDLKSAIWYNKLIYNRDQD